MSTNESAEAVIIVLKRIGKWILFASLSMVAMLLLVIAYEQINLYIQNRPKVVNELKGIVIGEKFSDFMFKNPNYSEAKESPKIGNGETYYENLKERLGVVIKDYFVSEVTYICNDSYEYTSVNGISCDSLGDSILEKYGSDVRVQCLKNKSDKDYTSYRVYDAVKFGVRHHVFSNHVKAFHIVKHEELKDATGVKWGSCE